MLYDILTSIYSYFFSNKDFIPKKENKESIELKQRIEDLNKPTDEEVAERVARRHDMDFMAYKFMYMHSCQACGKFRYPENISYISKNVQLNDGLSKNSDFFEACKDDENCLINIRKKYRI